MRGLSRWEGSSRARLPARNTAAEALPADPAAADVVASALRDLEDAIVRALAHGQDTGEVAADIDLGAHARMLVALTQGLHVTARAETDPRRLADARRRARAVGRLGRTAPAGCGVLAKRRGSSGAVDLGRASAADERPMFAPTRPCSALPALAATVIST